MNGDGSDAAREVAEMWRAILEARVERGDPLELAFEETYPEIAASLEDGIGGFPFINATTILSETMEDGQRIRTFCSLVFGV